MNELYHYGVKGMKWGVRHDRTSSSGRKKTTGKRDDEPSKVSRAIAKGKRFCKRNGKTIATFAISTGLGAVGLGFLSSGAIAALNIGSTEHRHYLEKTSGN